MVKLTWYKSSKDELWTETDFCVEVGVDPVTIPTNACIKINLRGGYVP